MFAHFFLAEAFTGCVLHDLLSKDCNWFRIKLKNSITRDKIFKKGFRFKF